jgi:RNA polymerase sigma-70 factor, ECF subfamily
MTAGAPRSDGELLAQSRRQSGEARRVLVDELFARHYERVARWCYRFTGDREAAADLAQDVFLKAHRHLDSFQGQAQFSTWLYAIVRNESMSSRRRAGDARETDDEEALADAPSPAPDPEDLAALASRQRRVDAFLGETLNGEERRVFTLHYGQDMPLDAITRLLRLDNASGAKALIVSAKRKIARAVGRVRARGEQW